MTDTTHPLLRLAVSMYVGMRCEHCSLPYDDVDDIIRRNPRRGFGADLTLVDEVCWPYYAARYGK